MIPQDYWTTERILQQKSRLLKQRNQDEFENETNLISQEVFASEALTAAKYKKANLGNIVQNCKVLNEEQKEKLLVVLNNHDSLFQGKRGNWKGQPVSIEVMNGVSPVWSKPYPVPLKNREIFKEEVY